MARWSGVLVPAGGQWGKGAEHAVCLVPARWWWVGQTVPSMQCAGAGRRVVGWAHRQHGSEDLFRQHGQRLRPIGARRGVS